LRSLQVCLSLSVFLRRGLSVPPEVAFCFFFIRVPQRDLKNERPLEPGALDSLPCYRNERVIQAPHAP
jgi:hypothetical protein